MSSSPVRSQAGDLSGDDENAPASQLLFYTQAPHDMDPHSSANTLNHTSERASQNTRGLMELLKSFPKTSMHSVPLEDDRPRTSRSEQLASVHDYQMPGRANGTEGPASQNESARARNIHTEVECATKGVRGSPVNRAPPSIESISHEENASGIDIMPPSVRSPAKSNEKNLGDNQQRLNAVDVVQNPFLGHARIPRNFVQIARDQKKLLEQEGSWYRAQPAVSSAINIPKKILDDLVSFPRPSNSTVLEDRGQENTIMDRISESGIRRNESSSANEVVNEKKSAHTTPMPNADLGKVISGSPAACIEGQDVTEATSPYLSGEPATGLPSLSGHISESNSTVSEAESWPESEVENFGRSKTSSPVQHASPAVVTRQREVFQAESGTASSQYRSPRKDAKKTCRRSPNRISTVPFDVLSSSPAGGDNLEMAIPYTVDDVVEPEDVHMHLNPNVTEFPASATGPMSSRLQVELTPYIKPSETFPPHNKSAVATILPTEHFSSDLIIPGTFDALSINQEKLRSSNSHIDREQTRSKLSNLPPTTIDMEGHTFHTPQQSKEDSQTYASQNMDQHVESADAGSLTQSACEHVYSSELPHLGCSDHNGRMESMSPEAIATLQVPRSQHNDGSPVKSTISSRSSVKRGADFEAGFPMPSRKRQTLMVHTDSNLSQEDYRDAKEIIRANRLRFLMEMRGEDVDTTTDTATKRISADIFGSRLNSTLEESGSSQASITPKDGSCSDSNLESSSVKQDLVTCAYLLSQNETHVLENVSTPRADTRISDVGDESVALPLEASAEEEPPALESADTHSTSPTADIGDETSSEQEDVIATNVWDKYRLAYPLYDESLSDFVEACVYIEWLVHHIDKELHRFLWDDFTRAFSQYRIYAKQCEVANRIPETALKFYNNHVASPLYRKGVITPSTLSEALSLEPAKTARAWEKFLRRLRDQQRHAALTSSQENALRAIKLMSHQRSLMNSESEDPVKLVNGLDRMPGTKAPYFETPSQLAGSTTGSPITKSPSRHNINKTESSRIREEHVETPSSARRLPWSLVSNSPPPNHEPVVPVNLAVQIESQRSPNVGQRESSDTPTPQVSIDRAASTTAKRRLSPHHVKLKASSILLKQTRRQTTGPNEFAAKRDFQTPDTRPKSSSGSMKNNIGSTPDIPVMSWKEFSKAYGARRRRLSRLSGVESSTASPSDN